MNIFVLDLDPKKAAEYHCDKHVVKMIVESSQMLCTCHYYRQHPSVKRSDIPYKMSYIHHPCNIWVRESFDNYMWLLDLLYNLTEEFNKRYGHHHKIRNEGIFKWLEITPLDLGSFPSKGLTPFAQAMPEKWRHQDPVVAYRNYYIEEKRDICKWSTSIPEWWMDKNCKEMGIAKRVLALSKTDPTRKWFEENFFHTRESKKPILSVKTGDLVELDNGIETIILKYMSNKEIIVGIMGEEVKVSKEEIVKVVTTKEQREQLRKEKDLKIWSDISNK